MEGKIIPKKVNGEGDQLIDVEDLVAEKEEECLYVRFQKHFAIRGCNGKFEKFNKIAQDFSKSRKFLKRFWLKRMMVIFFNLFSKLPLFHGHSVATGIIPVTFFYRYWNIIIIVLPSNIQFGAFQLPIAERTLLCQHQK